MLPKSDITQESRIESIPMKQTIAKNTLKGGIAMDFYQRALELNEETVAHRRYLHQNAEVGLHMPKAIAYITEKLTEYGLEPRPCGHGVTVLIFRACAYQAVFAATSAAWTGKIVTIGATSCCSNCLLFF